MSYKIMYVLPSRKHRKGGFWAIQAKDSTIIQCVWCNTREEAELLLAKWQG
jgi:hypothetical protein